MKKDWMEPEMLVMAITTGPNTNPFETISGAPIS
jgi:hypothetical protein